MPSTEKCNSLESSIEKVILVQEEMRVDLNEHVEHFHQHVEHFAKHEALETSRHDQFLKAQAENTAAIHKLCVSTDGVVEVWNTMGSLVKFLKFIASIVAAVAVIWAFFSDHSPFT